MNKSIKQITIELLKEKGITIGQVYNDKRNNNRRLKISLCGLLSTSILIDLADSIGRILNCISDVEKIEVKENRSTYYKYNYLAIYLKK